MAIAAVAAEQAQLARMVHGLSQCKTGSALKGRASMPQDLRWLQHPICRQEVQTLQLRPSGSTNSLQVC